MGTCLMSLSSEYLFFHFFFFGISNVRNFIKKNQPSTLEVYYSGTNQESRLQLSIRLGREKQE